MKKLLALLLAALMLLALVAGTAVSPNLIGRLLVRAVAPWVDVGNLFADEIVVTPGDVVALSGDVIRIQARAQRPSSFSTTAASIRRIASALPCTAATSASALGSAGGCIPRSR